MANARKINIEDFIDRIDTLIDELYGLVEHDIGDDDIDKLAKASELIHEVYWSYLEG